MPMPLARLVDRLFTALLVVFVVLLLVASVSYWRAPCFLDHFEAHIACVAHRVWTGHPIYHDLDAADRYSTVLGPNTYLWNALLQGRSPRTIADAKTPGLIACWAALVVFGAALWLRFGAGAALAGCGVWAMCGLLFRHVMFWNRSDSLLMLLVSLAVAAVLTRRVAVGAALFGAVVGLALGVKLHSLVFFVPLCAWFDRRILAAKPLAIGAGAAVAAAATPFLLPQVSLTNHLRWLSALSAGPVLGHDTGRAALLLALFALPVAALTLASTETRWRRAAFWLAAALAAIGGTLWPGLERHHVMALAAPVALMTAEWMQNKRPAASWGLVALFVALGGWFAVSGWLDTKSNIARAAAFAPVARDFDAVMAGTSGLSRSVGCGSLRMHRLTQIRVALAFREDEPLYLDGPALMDHRKAGVPLPAATIDAIRDKKTDLWILPRDGAPWSLHHFYNAAWNIFPETFRRAFADNYHIAGQSEFFTLWLANGKTLPAGAARFSASATDP